MLEEGCWMLDVGWLQQAGRPFLRPLTVLPTSNICFLLFAFLFFAAFALGFEFLFLAFGPLGRALYELAANQLDHGLLGAVAFAEAQPYDARIAAVTLSEPSAQR